MLVSDFIKFKKSYSGCLFGIEIEVEGKRLPKEVEGFLVKEDGSLRGENQEYVFYKPSTKEESVSHLNTLANSFIANNSKLDYSFRTSTHVHMNVLDLECKHVLNLIYLYLLLEGCFINYSGKSRIGNRFCLRLCDAEGFIDSIHNGFMYDGQRIKDFNNEDLKYSSINLAAIINYGSLEFRSLSGTHEVGRILPWMCALEKLRDISQRYDSALEIYNTFVDNSLNIYSLLEEVFEENLHLFLYDDMLKDFLINASLSISIPFEIKFTNNVKAKIPDKVKPPKNNDNLQNIFDDVLGADMNIPNLDLNMQYIPQLIVNNVVQVEVA